MFYIGSNKVFIKVSIGVNTKKLNYSPEIMPNNKQNNTK
jgi:hypothetical protein